MVVEFNRPTEPYYEFHTFFTNHIMILQEYSWTCVEQYFQAQKFYIPSSPRHMEYYKIIQAADSPMKAHCLGRQEKNNPNFNLSAKDKRNVNEMIEQYKDLQIRNDWRTMKNEIMKRALIAKFQQNPDLLEILLHTDDDEIIAYLPSNYYWGVGKTKKGENHLGKLLMQVRKLLSPSI